MTRYTVSNRHGTRGLFTVMCDGEIYRMGYPSHEAAKRHCDQLNEPDPFVIVESLNDAERETFLSNLRGERFPWNDRLERLRLTEKTFTAGGWPVPAFTRRPGVHVVCDGAIPTQLGLRVAKALGLSDAELTAAVELANKRLEALTRPLLEVP